MKASDVKKELKLLANPEKAKILSGFFKTGKGHYGEGDQFIGVKVPEIRKVIRKYTKMELDQVDLLLQSKIHEERFAALAILKSKFEKANEAEKKKIYDYYLSRTDQINNWDLVDVSAPHIVGGYLYPLGPSSWKILYKMAGENNLWRKRIAILSTFTFIREGHFQTSLDILEMVLNDTHDLIHKAAGWMLREIANRDRSAAETFLKKHCKEMPRTMLRYAIEKFPEDLRQEYLKKECLPEA